MVDYKLADAPSETRVQLRQALKGAMEKALGAYDSQLEEALMQLLSININNWI